MRAVRPAARATSRDARLAFDLALDTLLVMPGGGRSDPRLSAAVDSLTDRISAIELAALSSGDGFTETTSEPASIDTLLSLPADEADGSPAPEVATGRPGRPRRHRARHPDSPQRPCAALRRAVPGTPARAS